MSGEQLELLWKVIVAVFVAGGFWNELKAIRRDIKRLEKKQDAYNTLQERMIKQEVLTHTQQQDIDSMKQVIYGNSGHTEIVH